MKNRELIQILQTFDPDAEVVINPDVKYGKFKAMPQKRPRRHSYEPDAEVTERTVNVMGVQSKVVCIELGEDAGLVNPMNQI